MSALASLGGLLEARRWAFGLELVRLIVIVAVAFWVASAGPAVAALGLALGSGAWLARYRHSYTPATPTLAGAA